MRVAQWDLAVCACQAAMSWRYRFRVEGRWRIPHTGPVIFVANHQSLLDPMIHGIAVTDRAPRPMAKESLFRNPLLGLVLRRVGCISVREGGGNMDAIRTGLDELAHGRTVMLYPEGTRSVDGEVKPFRRGVEFLLRKSNAAIVPMGIDGAFQVWPRGQKWPQWNGRIWAAIGEPIPEEERDQLLSEPDAGLETLRLRVERLMRHCRGRLGAASGCRQSEGASEAWLS